MNEQRILEKLVPTLFEDEHLLAVLKPAGVDVTRMRQGPTPGLIDLLTELRGSGPTLHVTNRLSRYESGVLLLGKDAATAQHIRTGFKTRRIRQEFVGVARGRMREARIRIEPGGPTAGGRPDRRRRTVDSKRSASARPASRDVREPTLITRMLEGDNRTLLRCRTTVENTHVLKAELRSVRLRLLGDGVADRSPRPARAESTCLHLSKVAFFHPVRKAKITISTRAPDAFTRVAKGGRAVERMLAAGVLRRLSLLSKPATNAFRLLTGDCEGVRGLVAEKFANLVILQVAGDRPALAESIREIGVWYQETLGVDAVCVKRIMGSRASADAKITEDRPSAKPVVGGRVPDRIDILERGLTFAIRPDDGLSVGLFLDQRDNRSRIRALAEGKEVLNLFAYTCGFSVAAAAGGAKRTVSVDISPKHLEWGRLNFELNGFALDDHQFILSDASDYFKRATRQEKLFDLIVLDPPTFAHTRAKTRSGRRNFSIARDLPEVIGGAVSLLRSGGIIMISSNYRRLTKQALRDHLREGSAGRSHRVMDTPALPPDFAIDSAHAKTIVARFA